MRLVVNEKQVMLQLSINAVFNPRHHRQALLILIILV